MGDTERIKDGLAVLDTSTFKVSATARTGFEITNSAGGHRDRCTDM